MQVDAPRSAGEQDGFGRLLRHHRALAGLSQEALAERAGLSRRGIADLERGARRFPYPDTARRLAAALELTGDDLTEFMTASRPGQRGRSARYLLPFESSPLVGRHSELAELSRLAVGSRAVTLSGTGGIGKTRLALELARQLEPDYADGAVLVELAPVVEAAGVPDALATALGVAVRPGESVTECVRRHLETRELLLVLDNCEHIVHACAQLADVLLRAISGLRLIVTSREPLRIHGETVWVVPPLGAGESVTLFLQRAQAATAATRLTPADIAKVTEICGRLDGIPLAIELSAVRVPALGVTRVANLLSNKLEFLSRGNRLDSPRHQTLRGALDWSYALLDPGERRLFQRLAVFAGGWSLEAAGTVCAGHDVSGPEVLDVLVSLVDKSLVIAEDDASGQRRYRFLETIREYAAEVLAASGDGGRVHARHADFFRALAEEAAVTRLGIRYPGDVSRLRHEHANLRTALRWLLDEGRLDEGLDLCQALGGFWLSQGFLREGEEWFAQFLQRPEHVPPRALAGGLYAWGRLAEYGGALDRARELFERSRSTSIAHRDLSVLARALVGLGDVAVHSGHYGEALDTFQQALDAAHAADSEREAGQALLCLGRVANLLGDVQQSRVWLEQALTVQRRLADRWGVAYALNELGQQARRAGQFEQAQGFLEECHVLWRQTGTRMGERAAVMNLALVALDRGAFGRSAELALNCLELSQDIGDDDSVATVRCVEIATQILRALDPTPTVVSFVAAASRRREMLGAPRPVVEQPDVDLMLEDLRRAFGECAFDESWDRGQTLTIHAAVDLVAASLARCIEIRSR